MLQILVPVKPEEWDEKNQKFIAAKEQVLQLEHSLVSLSKWEAKWRKAFLSTKNKTREEVLDYIKCMTITQNVKPEVYDCLTSANIAQVEEYIDAPMTATTISEDKNGKKSREIVTSELIYYWMISLNIPFECQKWHLNRLLTLIRVCDIKNSPPKKRSKKDIMSSNAKLNAARRKKMGSRG